MTTAAAARTSRRSPSWIVVGVTVFLLCVAGMVMGLGAMGCDAPDSTLCTNTTAATATLQWAMRVSAVAAFVQVVSAYVLAPRPALVLRLIAIVSCLAVFVCTVRLLGSSS